MIDDINCRTCYYWGKFGNKNERDIREAEAYCYRYPPVVMVVGSYLESVRPKTKGKEGCGEWDGKCSE